MSWGLEKGRPPPRVEFHAFSSMVEYLMKAEGSGNFWFLRKLNCVMGCSSGSCLVRGYFAEQTHEKACDVLLEWTLDGACDVWKECKWNPINNERWLLHGNTMHCLTGLAFSLVFAGLHFSR